jgi:DNA-binding CsgD family transcriptional regulator
MSDITLTAAQQYALRSLLAAEAVPGTPLPTRRVLQHVAVLIPCHSILALVADTHGQLLEVVDLPRSPARDVDGRGVSPWRAGLRWAAREPDRMLLGYRNGPDLIVQLVLDRRTPPFSSRDVAILRLLEPALERLLRERPAPHLPDQLTVQERRVLRLVAAGRSNAEIAERMGIASCTVRKHLEHAFPKLGVTNRLAAAMAFEGRSVAEPVGAGA